MSAPIPVLLDTDIGSDIDDAVCLAYLLAHPQCELVGITTVSGEPERRVQLCDALCRAAGREDIPIHSGSPSPLLIPQQQRKAAQAEALSRFPHRAEVAPATAVEFMRQTIRQRPGEITLLAIGPLTNVGLLFALDPEIPQLLKRLVLMGGKFSPKTCCQSVTEWNIKLDPQAATIVYQAPVASHLSIGLDVTIQCTLPADECRQRMRDGVLGVVGAMAEVWFRHTGEITFHDPLASAVIFAPDLCTYEDGHVEVELASPRVAGMTHWTPTANGPHRIAVGVDPAAFFSHYFAVVGG
jgi:purine nucleosidase